MLDQVFETVKFVLTKPLLKLLLVLQMRNSLMNPTTATLKPATQNTLVLLIQDTFALMIQITLVPLLAHQNSCRYMPGRLRMTRSTICLTLI